jgi:hypothetical protein
MKVKKYLKKNSFLNFPISTKTFLKILFKKNKIKTAIMLFFCIFIFIIFSGCNELYKNANNNSKKVEILSYNITTEWSTGCTCDDTYEYHIETGFYHTIYMSTQASYFIKGEIKNIGKNKINSTYINLDFLSKNGTILFDTEILNATYTIYNLSKEEIKSFLIEVKPELYNYYEDPNFYNQLREYFQKVESLEFDISMI